MNMSIYRMGFYDFNVQCYDFGCRFTLSKVSQGVDHYNNWVLFFAYQKMQLYVY